MTKARRALRLVLLAAVSLACAPAHAVFIVNAPWLRPAATGETTELYMTLTSTEEAALVGVRSEIAAEARIFAGGTPVRAVSRLPLPAGRDVGLVPAGSRIRLVGLTRALALGDRVPLVLTIESAGGGRQEISVDAEVRRRSAIDDHRHGYAH